MKQKARKKLRKVMLFKMDPSTEEENDEEKKDPARSLEEELSNHMIEGLGASLSCSSPEFEEKLKALYPSFFMSRGFISDTQPEMNSFEVTADTDKLLQESSNCCNREGNNSALSSVEHLGVERESPGMWSSRSMWASDQSPDVEIGIDTNEDNLDKEVSCYDYGQSETPSDWRYCPGDSTDFDTSAYDAEIGHQDADTITKQNSQRGTGPPMQPRMIRRQHSDSATESSFEVIDADMKEPPSDSMSYQMSPISSLPWLLKRSSAVPDPELERFYNDIMKRKREQSQEHLQSPCDEQLSIANVVISIRGLINICGTDVRGRPIVVIDASCCPPPPMRRAALGYIQERMEPVVESGDYHLLFVMSPSSSKGEPQKEIPMGWCLDVYRKLPQLYKTNIQRVVLIHPTFSVKVVLSMLRPFISSKAYLKISKVYRLADLEKKTGGDIILNNLQLGPHVFAHEKSLEKSSKRCIQNTRKRLTWFKAGKKPLRTPL